MTMMGYHDIPPWEREMDRHMHMMKEKAYREMQAMMGIPPVLSIDPARAVELMNQVSVPTKKSPNKLLLLTGVVQCN